MGRKCEVKAVRNENPDRFSSVLDFRLGVVLDFVRMCGTPVAAVQPELHALACRHEPETKNRCIEPEPGAVVDWDVRFK